MSGQPWLKFYPSDWRADAALRTVSLAARGLWIDVLSLMHEADPYGHLVVNGVAPDPNRLARILGCSGAEVVELLAELEAAGVFSRTDNGTIYSRRMVRDDAKAGIERVANRLNGAKGGNPQLRRGTVPKHERNRRFRRSDNPAKARRIFNKSKGVCHWCSTALEYDGRSGTAWHADHVIAIADGGTNDDNNLVAACADCNHKRARVGWSDPNSSDPNRPKASDPKPQKLDSRLQNPERKVPASPGADAPLDDARSVVWAEGLALLIRITGLPAAKARTRLGQLLRNASDDCPGLLRVLRECPQTGDPQAWLTRAAQGLATPRGPPSKLAWMLGDHHDDPTTIDHELEDVRIMQ